MSLPDVLYHYCSASAFHAIVESREVWLSALSVANDNMEGQLLKHRVCDMAESAGISPQQSLLLGETLSTHSQIMHGVGFCLSEVGDLLSQWRGYASDGNGFSIGFSRRYIELLREHMMRDGGNGFGLRRIEYDEEKQKAALGKLVDTIVSHIKDGAYDPSYGRTILDSRTDEEFAEATERKKDVRDKLTRTTALTLFNNYDIKSDDFKEEREWRMLAFLTRHTSDERTEFRVVNDRLVPFARVPLAKLDAAGPLVEIVLGPKNLTPVDFVKEFVERSSFSDVTIRRSSSTYR